MFFPVPWCGSQIFQGWNLSYLKFADGCWSNQERVPSVEKEGVRGPCVVGCEEGQRLLGLQCCPTDCQAAWGSHYGQDHLKAPTIQTHFSSALIDLNVVIQSGFNADKCGIDPNHLGIWELTTILNIKATLLDEAPTRQHPSESMCSKSF